MRPFLELNLNKIINIYNDYEKSIKIVKRSIENGRFRRVFMKAFSSFRITIIIFLLVMFSYVARERCKGKIVCEKFIYRRRDRE